MERALPFFECPWYGAPHPAPPPGRGSRRSPAGRTARGAAPRLSGPTRRATPPRAPVRTVTEASMFRDGCDGARTAYRALVTTVTNQ
ncbi:hypothetical protein GCM10018789_12220 [Streptomyces werraensis]|nr:hypothetical protein GCM10018789_12220 [Streptomyces werraensis]